MRIKCLNYTYSFPLNFNVAKCPFASGVLATSLSRFVPTVILTSTMEKNVIIKIKKNNFSQ